MKSCSWCKRSMMESSPFPDVCELCHSRYVEKKDFVSPLEKYEDTPEEELRALACPFGDEAEAIINARIKRVTEEIQDSWTPDQMESRRVQKKTCRWVSVPSSALAIQNSV